MNEDLVWHGHLDGDLLARAYGAGEELAWSRADALRVVDALERAGCVILGVDVWLPTEGGPTIPTPFVHDWSEGELSDPRGRGIPARAFIEFFAWDPDDRSPGMFQPYFNLTVRAGGDRSRDG